MDREFSSSASAPKSLLRKFNSGKTPKEKKQIRLVLLLLFGLTALSVSLAVLYRELPSLLKKFSQPSSPVVSEQFASLSPTATPTPKLEKEKEAVMEITKQLRGKYGVFFQDLQTKDAFEINSKEIFTAASLIKLPVIITLYREAEAGRINLDEVYKLQASDKISGAGSLQYKSVGFEITFREMAELMGQQSDNTAFGIVSRKLGKEKIQELINALGMKSTSFAENETSPEDIGLLFRKLYSEGVVYEKDKQEILSFLTDTIWEDRIPAGVPKEIKVSHKIGTEVGVISDAGIVFAKKPFILVIMTEGANEIEAKKALPQITEKLYEMWTTKIE
jgi:beta-lactamase class A